jgi:hypothetical protein
MLIYFNVGFKIYTTSFVHVHLLATKSSKN